MAFDDYLTRLEELYRQRALPLACRDAASLAQLQAVEQQLGLELPEDLRTAWLTTDGLGDCQTVFARPGRLTGYDFLSLAAALRAREGLRRRAATYSRYTEPEPRDARIGAGWFQPGWLPFAGFGGGTLLLLLDMAPASAGTPGQIIAFTHDPDQIEYVAQSFADLLKGSLEAIAADAEEFLGSR
ncbi:MAG TPA: SMI1/KNR4 family protein [Polyangiaceae bacterium]|nr:SMI1/KNR4 family protein [Polyangiaceae bacterium]